MILIEDTLEIPEALWNETSSKEFAMMPLEAHKALLDLSEPIKRISLNGKLLVIAGLYRRSFFSLPYLWVLLTKDFRSATPAILRGVIRTANTFAPQCETLVEQDNERAERLAGLFGFQLTSGVFFVGETVYRMYRRG